MCESHQGKTLVAFMMPCEGMLYEVCFSMNSMI